MYYRVYIRAYMEGSYSGPFKCNTYEEAKNKISNGEYLIIKCNEDGDEIVEHGIIKGKNRKNFERE